MSIVGTRPPTLDEWNKYELHHRARLAIKPGITGMWQVSGRSEIGRVAFNGEIPMFYTPHGYSFLMENYKPMKLF